jgi:hypothetical protein
MFYVQFSPRLQDGSHGPLATEKYASPDIARQAFRSLSHIAWAELVADDGSVIERREVELAEQLLEDACEQASI